MKTVRMAIIGSGKRWKDLDQFFTKRPNLEIVAICDFAEGAAEEAAARIKEMTGDTPAVYHSYEELTKNAVYDASFIMIDPDIQVQFAVAEMDRGIHVMTEVPAAYTIDQCWDLVKAVKRNGVKYQLGEQTRYWSFMKEWRKMAQRGDFGKIYYAEGEYLHFEKEWDFFRYKDTKKHIWCGDNACESDPNVERAWRYRFFQHPILYLPHELSPLLSVTGGRIEKVSCLGTKRGESYMKGFDIRDMECALMHNSNGAIFSLRAGFTSPHGHKKETYAHWYQIKGTECSVEWARSDMEHDEPKMFTLKDGWTKPGWVGEDPNDEDAAIFEMFKGKGHGGIDYYPIHYFVDAILNDTTPPMDVFKAVESAAPAILAAESSEKGGIQLDVPDFRVLE